VRERSCVVFGVLVLTACLEPYRPACNAGAEQTLSARPGALTEHTGGRWRSTTLNGGVIDGGLELRATARGFTAAGEPFEESTLVLGGPRPGGASVSALTDGFAVVSPQSSPDGGRELVVELFSLDGGVARAVVPTGALGGLVVPRPTTAEVGAFVHLFHVGADGPEVLAFARDATLVARRAVEPGVVVDFGPDATAVAGTLLSPRLEVVTAREPSMAPELAAWDRGSKRWAVARVEGTSVLVDQFAFDAAPAGARRVTSGERATAVGLAPRGAGVMFQVLRFEGDTPRTDLWFAAVDSDGLKRGPDVPLLQSDLMPTLVAPPRLSASGDSSFGVFFQTLRGLLYQEVRCE